MTWYSWKGEILFLELRIQPRAKQNDIAGIMGDRLRIRIQSPPVDGKANKCLVNFLGAQFDVPTSKVKLINGHNNRNKRVAIHAPLTQPAWFQSLVKKEPD